MNRLSSMTVVSGVLLLLLLLLLNVKVLCLHCILLHNDNTHRFHGNDRQRRTFIDAASMSLLLSSLSSSSSPSDSSVVDTVVCGGGPAGLLATIMMAKYDPSSRIRVFERRPVPPSPDDCTVWNDLTKSYLIGLGSRGQAALKRFGVWEEVAKRGIPVVGRKDWTPNSPEGVERIYTTRDKHVTTVVLPRDKLVGVLYKYVVENLSDRVELLYGQEVVSVDWSQSNSSKVILTAVPTNFDSTAEEPRNSLTKICSTESRSTASNELCIEQEGKFLIAADGAQSTIADSIAAADREHFRSARSVRHRWFRKPFRVHRYPDNNKRVYKTVPLKLPLEQGGWRPDLNYSVRSRNARVIFEALPANAKGEYCGVLLLRSDDDMAKANVHPALFREFLNSYLPQFSNFIEEETLISVASKPASTLPGFSYAEPRLHQGNSCVLLGDGAHTVKPYFGLGANSALEDVAILGDVLQDKGQHDDMQAVCCEFSRIRAEDSKMVVRLSYELDQPGIIGFFTFILPLILDSIFHRYAPKLFAPNIITMLQREQYTFRQVARRKRLDRVFQAVCVGFILWMPLLFTQIVIARMYKHSRLHASYGTLPIQTAISLCCTCIAFRFIFSVQSIFKRN